MTSAKGENKAGKREKNKGGECFTILDRVDREKNLTENVTFEQRYEGAYVQFFGKYGEKLFFDLEDSL